MFRCKPVHFRIDFMKDLLGMCEMLFCRLIFPTILAEP
jgi:hypothetical protein